MLLTYGTKSCIKWLQFLRLHCRRALGTIANFLVHRALPGNIIKAIDQQRLERLHGEFAADDVRRLVMHELALARGIATPA